VYSRLYQVIVARVGSEIFVTARDGTPAFGSRPRIAYDHPPEEGFATCLP